MLRLAASAAILAACALPARAADQDFKLVNKTGYQIDEVYVGPTSSDTWGDDVMGKNSLEADRTVSISFNAPSNVCKWDLKVKYEDGDSAQWSNLNLCNISTVTLYWDRKAGKTRAVTD